MIERTNLLLEIHWKWRLLDPRPYLLAARGEGRDIVGIEAFQPLVDPLTELAGSEEFAERVGGGSKAAGDPDARIGKGGGHFAQRGVLAADLRQVGQTQIF